MDVLSARIAQLVTAGEASPETIARLGMGEVAASDYRYARLIAIALKFITPVLDYHQRTGTWPRSLRDIERERDPLVATLENYQRRLEHVAEWPPGHRQWKLHMVEELNGEIGPSVTLLDELEAWCQSWPPAPHTPGLPMAVSECLRHIRQLTRVHLNEADAALGFRDRIAAAKAEVPPEGSDDEASLTAWLEQQIAWLKQEIEQRKTRRPNALAVAVEVCQNLAAYGRQS